VFSLFRVAMVCLLGALALSGQARDGQRIAGIRFTPAEQPIPDGELRETLGLKVGDVYTQVGLRGAMAAMYRTGRFTNIVVEATETGAGLELNFVTEKREFNGNVDVIGAPGSIAKGGLINAAKMPLGAEFDTGLLTQAVESLESELRLEGFYESQVRYELIRDPQHDQVNIQFYVAPGQHARFGAPRVKGNQLLKTEQVIAATKWRRLVPSLGYRFLSEQRVQSGMRNVQQAYRKKEHLMTKVQLDRLDYQSEKKVAIPSLSISEGPRVEVRAIGTKIRKPMLRKLVPIYEEQSIDKDLLLEGTRKVESYLHSKGYFDAKVTYDVEQDGVAVEEIDPKVDTYVDYHVETGKKFKVRSVEISGNQYFKRRDLVERIAVRPATFVRYRNGRYSDELLEGDRNAIAELYRSNGFLKVAVTSDVTKGYQGKADEVGVKIRIVEGPQTMVEAVRIEGVVDSDKAVLEGYVTATAGQPYSILTVNSDRERILNVLYQTGFSEATMEVRVEAGSEPETVQLVYTIAGGTQHFVREVVVSGLKTTDPALVGKRIKLQPGDPLNNTEILASQRRLYDLGIFARVDTAQQNPEGKEISKTLLFNLEEASRWSFNGGVGAEIARIGGGVTSFDSPAGGTGFSPRVSLGVNRANFLGLGHTIGAQTRLSNIQRRVLLSYLAPQFRDNDKFNLTVTALYDDARNVRTFNSKRLEGNLQLAQRFGLGTQVQYRATYRRVTIDENTLKVAPSLIPLLAQPVRVGSFSSTFSQDRRDDPVDAKRGRYTTVDVGVASKLFLSSTNFTRVLTRNSSYHRVGKDIVFARSINFGILAPYRASGLTSQTDVPLPERFFGGGANSHRGFPENQAGPRDLTTGFPLGGKAILVNNLELRVPLIGDNLGGVFFHDMGNVFSDLKRVSFRFRQRDLTDFDYMVHSVGFGIRYRTPIGPVRIDLAFTPNSPRFRGFEGSREDLLFGRGREAQLRVNQFQFHISLGQAF
jgi:outer membrane protein insertion porin family